MTKNIKSIIIGASGYTGIELIRILHQHPNVEISYLVANSSAGQTAAEIYPHLQGFNLPHIVTIDEVSWDNIDIVFCCLPHGTSHSTVNSIPENIKIIDLSADFRFSNVDLFEKNYEIPHLAPDLQKEVVYGLSEIYREQIASSRIVACPGCYPTSALLPLYPLLQKNLIEQDYIIVDAKTGVTGAGRKASQGTLFSEIDSGMKAYNISKHRHAPEMEHILSDATDNHDIAIQFTPQLVPMRRGILATIYARIPESISVNDIRNQLTGYYKNSPFVLISEEGIFPSTREVYSTNQCRIAVCKGRHKNSIVIISVIDNLTKGSSGQAVQNMNIMFGLPEITGLDIMAVYP